MKIKMTKFEILAEFVKDISSETKDIQTYLFVKDYISKYQLTIDITSLPSKNKMIEVNTSLKFEDKENNSKKSYFELIYASLIKINENIKERKELEKIILCDVQNKIYNEWQASDQLQIDNVLDAYQWGEIFAKNCLV